MRRYLPFLLILLSAFLSGCLRLYDPEASQEQNSGAIATIESGQAFEQSFIARRPGLDAIEINLGVPPGTSAPPGLRAEVYPIPEESSPVATVQLTPQQVSNGNAIIDLPPQADSAGRGYTLRLITDSGNFQVSGKAEDVYPKGSASVNGQPLQGDAAFRLYYDYDWQALLSDLWNYAAGSWLLIPLAVLLVLPGFLALDLLDLNRYFSGGERLALWVGFSLAAIPVAMTWTTILHLPWSRSALWFTAGLLCALCFWRLLPKMRKPRLAVSSEGLALAAVILVTLLVRLIMVRDLSASPWVDSVHHGVITRLILETGGFPPSYAPFIDIDSAQYHAGFHSVLASFQWLTGLELQQAMLLFGQVINALAALAVYLLAVRLSGSRLCGIFAALIAGIFTPMPAYFTSWGRYTHLTGLVILSAAFALLQWVIERAPTKPVNSKASPSAGEQAVKHTYLKWAGGIAAAGVTCAGLFLTHYRVVAFLGCLVLAYLLVQAITQVKGKQLLRDLGVVALVAVLALLLALPRLPATISTLVLPKLASWTGDGVESFNTFAWTYLTAGLGRYTLVLAGLGLVWAFVRRAWFSLTLVVWVALLFIISNPGRLGLPGGGFINNTSVQISLYIPIAILGGYFVSQLISLLVRIVPARWQPAVYWGAAVAALPLVIIGARTLIPILNPVTFLFRQADLEALHFIQENVPEGETVLVNPFAWGYGLYAGNDGGYWISALADRETMPPPVLYGLQNDRNELRSINRLNQQVIENSANPEALAALMRQAGLHYLYIGAKGGVFSAQLLRESPAFENLFEANGTWLFKLLQEN
jgi:hypothetical protein